jgi:hypothetical protein
MESDFRSSQIPGYRWSQHPSNYGGIEQRWLVVESEIPRQSERRQLEKKWKKPNKKARKNFGNYRLKNLRVGLMP